MKKKEDVICFGAGGGGERLFNTISDKYNIIAFVDNDCRKWGTFLNNVPVLPVSDIKSLVCETIILTSAPGRDSIIKQLVEDYDILRGKIITDYIDEPLETRRIFLRNLSLIQADLNPIYQVAEAGVFQGDFAACINMYYPERMLHLFDTFNGFTEADIAYEKEKAYSNAREGDYANTSISTVLGKMSNPNNVIIHKGIFPDSARDIDATFCFVNLDLDLFMPTYLGLCFFEKRMAEGGVILIHDYFADNFKGPKEAVDRFVSERRGIYDCVPIGDGISILIIGFGKALRGIYE
ncbi:TylF/MycF/NovP-related O-methyltransferase [Butyrivibrio sp. AC2005]|uniref:TylF/MycF/NovP-related O-methyltransferase n=1 Tax=Butyrivibrio sp. AC2005 TaxID=1280672 RepID=UPI00040BA9AD|nr:TylF/MycF/NovP-related O-methyltransferase [Butyrivibrio sp. AC2005]